ncbi:hypothetical protein CR513_17157, partial [Mucuna pruriens]
MPRKEYKKLKGRQLSERTAEDMVNLLNTSLEITQFLELCRSLKGMQSTSQHRYTTRSKSKVMENKVEALEQQNQDLKGEVSQLKKQMAQMFQVLS